jgi:hypothetical protein
MDGPYVARHRVTFERDQERDTEVQLHSFLFAYICAAVHREPCTVNPVIPVTWLSSAEHVEVCPHIRPGILSDPQTYHCMQSTELRNLTPEEYAMQRSEPSLA